MVPESPGPSDLAFVRQILDGDVAAWHRFVEEYAGLIRHAVAGLVFDDDDVRTTTVDVLAGLYECGLAKYRGESSLSTWLVLVARNAARDALRRRHGRRATAPAGFDRLSIWERRVFGYYFYEGLGFEGVCHRLSAEGHSSDRRAVAEALSRIESTLTDRTLRRLVWDLSARGTGEISGRLLAYLEEARDESERASRAADPEAALIRREARRTADAVRKHVAELPESERRVLELRFEQGWTARRIAHAEGYRDAREVFTVVERVVRRLRRRFGEVSP